MMVKLFSFLTSSFKKNFWLVFNACNWNQPPKSSVFDVKRIASEIKLLEIMIMKRY